MAPQTPVMPGKRQDQYSQCSGKNKHEPPGQSLLCVIPFQPREAGTAIMPILQKRKPRHREARGPSQAPALEMHNLRVWLRVSPASTPTYHNKGPKPSAWFPVLSSKKCGSLIAALPSFPQGCGCKGYSGSRREMPEASEQEGTCPVVPEGNLRLLPGTPRPPDPPS